MKIIDKHIRLSIEDSLRIKVYASKRGLTFNNAVKELLSLGLDQYEGKEVELAINNDIQKIIKDQHYTKLLLEQLYSDFQLENLTDPSSCFLLKKFRERIKKDKFND